MIIRENSSNPAAAAAKPHTAPVLRWAKNDRMAGFVPVWGAPSSAPESSQQALSQALEAPPAAPGTARAYRPSDPASSSQSEPFGFGDLIDIVNPLQQIPIVGHIYRALTGDSIRPSGQIIGGALYGGFIGAGAGIVNAIAQEETGKDVAGNALGLMSGGKAFAKGAAYKYTIAAYDAAKPRYNQ